MKFRKCILAQGAPEFGQEPVPPMSQPSAEPVRKPRKKLYILIGIVAVAAVLLGTVLIMSIPQGLGATIPYGYSYNVGEKLTYSIFITESASGQQASVTGTGTMQVASFDGENYTFDETTHYVASNGVSQDNSFTIVMNKEGQMVNSSNLPSDTQNLYSMIQGSPGYGLFLNRTQIRVGETYQIPINMSNSSLSLLGTINYNVANTENFTVPAGTYNTFKLDFSTSNFHGTDEGIYVSANVNGQVIDEVGTCHPVEFNAQVSATAQGATVNAKVSMILIADTTG